MRLSACLLLLAIVFPAHADDRTPAEIISESTVTYAEIVDPPTFWTALIDHPLVTNIMATEQWKAARQTPGFKSFLGGLKFAELQMKMEWQEALTALTQNGLAFGIDAETRGVVIIAKARDAATTKQLRTKLLSLLRAGKTVNDIKEGNHRGIEAFQVGELKIAIHNEWVVATNKSETGLPVLDRLLDKDTDCIARTDTFQTAKASAPESGFWAYIDLKTIRDAGIGPKFFSGPNDNPLLEIMIGGIFESLNKTPFATASLTVDKANIAIDARIPHQPEWLTERRNYFWGTDGEGKGPQLSKIPDTLFTLSAHRDFGEMWLRAGDLFNERINDGFAEADSTLTTLFAVQDFGEDVLGSLTSRIGLIATAQDFENLLPRPEIKLPQFALVLELKDPDTMVRPMRRTFQSLVGFFNIQGAMEGRMPLELGMDRMENGAELHTSHYVPEFDEEESTSADFLFNFSPSVAFQGQRFVVSTTESLARTLISSPASNTATNQNTQANLDLQQLEDILATNKPQLVAQNMLEEGATMDEAQANIELVLQVVDYFQDLSFDLSSSSTDMKAELRLKVKDN